MVSSPVWDHASVARGFCDVRATFGAPRAGAPLKVRKTSNGRYVSFHLRWRETRQPMTRATPEAALVGRHLGTNRTPPLARVHVDPVFLGACVAATSSRASRRVECSGPHECALGWNPERRARSDWHTSNEQHPSSISPASVQHQSSMARRVALLTILGRAQAMRRWYVAQGCNRQARISRGICFTGRIRSTR